MENHKHHIVEYLTNLYVWVGLAVLTIVTIWVSEFDLKMLTVAVALGVATVKAVLVLMYFMHLKFDSKILTVMVIVTLIVFLSMIVFTFFDYTFRA
ncbi:MAG: cytochrome C oxidase subunit IV family protein [Bacteroidales bacterium]|jgi:cytochrome c oxidase subunit 4|nr:cytochrome C oxidase subunit IV family protein [Bacteroidales bacterium]MDD3664056.1 cytochrome C oxidase subunit IV family protein [Bacteroidales bacterium]